MHRTNLYLTDEQERALDSRARAAGISRSALVRRIVDDALADEPAQSAELDAAFAALADDYEDLVAGLFDDDPDLRIDR